MEKTISITLNGQVFNIEEEAYSRLKEYLDSIRNHLRSSDDKAEIISDIEASIAEKFSGKISDAKQVITKRDVEDLIAVMGTVEDLASELGEDEAGGEPASETGEAGGKHSFGKKLYRNSDDVVIAGVCSGLGAYFGIDPVIIRILFVVTFFAYGTSAFIYLILWIAMPMARTRTQKLEMHGDPVTLASIEESVKGKLPAEPETRAAWRRILYFPFEVIGALVQAIKNLFKALGPLVRIVLGLGIVGLVVFGMVSVLFFGGVMLFNVDSSFIQSDIPLEPIVTNPMYQAGIVAAMLAAVIPLFLLGLLGLSLMRRRNAISLLVGASLVGIWMLAAVTSGVAFMDIAPMVKQSVDESNANTKVRQLDFQDFDSLYVSGQHDVFVSQGEEFSVSVEGREADMERTEIGLDQNGKRLKISRENWSSWCVFCYNQGLKINITMPELNQVYGTHLSRTYIREFADEEIDIELQANAHAELSASTTHLSADMENTSRLFLEGQVDTLDIKAVGASRLTTNDLETRYFQLRLEDVADADLSGEADILEGQIYESADLNAFDMDIRLVELILEDSGEAVLGEPERLLVTGRDASKVYYRGNPEVEKHLYDVSSVRQREAEIRR